MLIRARYHWVALALSLFDVVMAVLWAARDDYFMAAFLMGSATLLMFVWSSSYTTLSQGSLITRICFVPTKRIAVDEIAIIRPHPKSGRWGYRGVIEVITKSGAKMALQPGGDLL